jgi:hypothetical protein
MAGRARSTTSASASAHAIIDATPVPAVSCVWTWIGSSGNAFLSALTSIVAARGFRSPAMSLMFRRWIPRSFSSPARSM